MSDRPLTLVLIAVAILIALYLRRSRGVATSSWVKSGTSHINADGIQVEQVSTRVPTGGELLSVPQMVREGEVRGIKVDLSQPMTREQFERFLGPVSVR